MGGASFGCHVTGSIRKTARSGDLCCLLVSVSVEIIEMLLIQNYDVNLCVTNLLSHLAALSPSDLDLYLFTPTSDHASHRTVFTVLCKVSFSIAKS